MKIINKILIFLMLSYSKRMREWTLYSYVKNSNFETFFLVLIKSQFRAYVPMCWNSR